MAGRAPAPRSRRTWRRGRFRTARRRAAIRGLSRPPRHRREPVEDHSPRPASRRSRNAASRDGAPASGDLCEMGSAPLRGRVSRSVPGRIPLTLHAPGKGAERAARPNRRPRFPGSLQRSEAEWKAIRDPAPETAAKRRRTDFAELAPASAGASSMAFGTGNVTIDPDAAATPVAKPEITEIIDCS